MAVQNILFPSGRWNLDFNAAGQDLGWVEIDGNRTLAEIANDIVDTGAGTNASHAIPSPIAHVKDFKTRLDNDDEDALNEWRGMLAVIALRKARGYAVSISDISLSKTDLGRVFFDALKDNSNVTGYTDGENVTGYIDNNGNRHDPVLTVFSMRDRNGKDKPFAMFMPSIGICPFKEYPSELFTNVPWYDSDKGKWNALKSNQFIQSDGTPTVEAQNLADWASSFAGTAAENIIKSKFGAYINNNAGTNQNNVKKDNTIETEAWDVWKNYCQVPQCIPEEQFSDKLLLILAPQGDNVITQTEGFVPQKLDLNAGTSNSGSVSALYDLYVIPPINDEVVARLRDYQELSLEGQRWEICPDYDNVSFKVSFGLRVAGRGLFPYEKTFDSNKIALVYGMPYISMWPKCKSNDVSWRDYLISILSDPSNKSDFLNKDGGIQISEQSLIGKFYYNDCVTKIDASKALKISVIIPNENPDDGNDSDPKEYKCTSGFPTNGGNSLTFSMIKSESKPFALKFEYEDANAAKIRSVGSWVIDYDYKNNGVNNQNGNTDMIIAMDFGTTSTNVYIADDQQNGFMSESISSPGKYVYDIYQPCVDKTGKDNMRNFYQNYYLFSKDNSPLGKICTLGQIFNAQVRKNRSGKMVFEPEQSTHHNISGRFIKADKEYMRKRYGDKNNVRNNTRTGIWGNLKWPTDDAAANDDVSKARNNFISALLTSAVFEAKDNGATNVNLRVSYPSSQLGGGITGTIDEIVKQLNRDSGMRITASYATEARCAGEFFKRNVPQGLNQGEGYAVVDIGGGTTDVSFWKNQQVRQPVDNHVAKDNQLGVDVGSALNTGGNGPTMETAVQAECSFRYAGRDIIEKTIIRYFDANQDLFDGFWVRGQQQNGDADFAALKGIYRNVNTKNLDINGYYIQKGEILNALLAESETTIKNGTYSELESAISFKYCALFFLVSSYLKNSGVELSKRLFQICLAGCGSHVIGSLSVKSKENLEKLLQENLELEKTKVELINPSLDRDDKSKSEVVRGLADLPRNDLVQVINNQNNANDENGFLEEPNDEVLEHTYGKLLNLLLHYNSGDALMTQICNDAVSDRHSIWYTRMDIIKNRVRATNCDPEIFPELFAVYMLDEVINSLLG